MRKLFITLGFLFLLNPFLHAQYDLEWTNVSFPDTMEVGETVTWSGYLKNSGLSDYYSPNGFLTINYFVADMVPSNVYAVPPAFTLNATIPNVIEKGDSVLITQQLYVNPAYFRSNNDIVVVVWPAALSGDHQEENHYYTGFTYIEESLDLMPSESNDSFVSAIVNPITQSLQLSFHQSASPATIEILNMQGSVVYRTNLTSASAAQSIPLHSVEYSPGMYLLKVYQDARIDIRKVLLYAQ